MIEKIKSLSYYYSGLFFPRFTAYFWFYRRFHRLMNLRNPKDLNEKINWLKFESDTSEWVKLADKFRVREYVKEVGLEQTLPRLIAYWDSPETINLDDIPKPYVLKMNNGSGDVLIVDEKSSISTDMAIKHFKPLFKEKFGYRTAELHYTKMLPLVIAEEMIPNDLPESKSIVDYKYWCFDGKPMYIMVFTNRNKHGADIMLYDLEWNAHPEYCHFNAHYHKAEIVAEPPHLLEMIEIARKLAFNHPCVRIDLYDTNRQVYFGEMTFTSAGGYMDYFTPEFLELTGSMVSLK